MTSICECFEDTHADTHLHTTYTHRHTVTPNYEMAFDIRGLDTGMTWHNQHFRLEGFKFFHKENVLIVNI